MENPKKKTLTKDGDINIAALTAPLNLINPLKGSDINIQLHNVQNNIIVINNAVDNVPIPGAKVVLSSIKYIINASKPNEFQEIMKELKIIEAKIDNMFSVVLLANDISSLREKYAIAKAKAESVSAIISLGKGKSGYYTELMTLIRELSENANEQISLCESFFLKDFKDGKKLSNGLLTTLVGDFLKMIRLVAQTVYFAQYAYNMILEYNRGLGNEMSEQDLGLNDAICGKTVNSGYSYNRLFQFKSFIEDTVPKNYPDWCRGIFSGESFDIYGTQGYMKYHYTKGSKEISVGSGGEIILASAKLKTEENGTMYWQLETIDSNKNYTWGPGPNAGIMIQLNNLPAISFTLRFDCEKLLFQYYTAKGDGKVLSAGYSKYGYRYIETKKLSKAGNAAKWIIRTKSHS